MFGLYPGPRSCRLPLLRLRGRLRCSPFTWRGAAVHCPCGFCVVLAYSAVVRPLTALSRDIPRTVVGTDAVSAQLSGRCLRVGWCSRPLMIACTVKVSSGDMCGYLARRTHMRSALCCLVYSTTFMSDVKWGLSGSCLSKRRARGAVGEVCLNG